MAIIIRNRLKRMLPAFKAKSVGIRLYAAPRAYLGIGDAIQFSSLPENFFRNYGQCLIDIDHHWIFDHNPYVIRYDKTDHYRPELVVDLWQDCDHLKCNMRKLPTAPAVYTSNAEANLSIMAHLFEVRPKVFLNRPRLYKFEDYPFEDRHMILLHTTGRSNGEMPSFLIEHILKKYGRNERYQLAQLMGPKDRPIEGIAHWIPATPWAAAGVISKALMFIGVDSGPAWIASCYPDVRVKKVRLTRPWGVVGNWFDWIPQQCGHPQSHWDDLGLFELYNLEEFDTGIFKSWRRI